MNPGRCERLFDGSITRTSPHARAARLDVRRFPKAMAAGSTPVSSAIPRGSASVDGGLSSRVETGALPVRGTMPSSPWWATGFQVRRTAFDSLARCQGDVQKAARLPCKQAHSERYRASPLRSRWRTSSPRRKRSTRSRFGIGGVSDAQGGRVRAAAKSIFSRVRCTRLHASLPTKRTRIVPELAHFGTRGVPVARHLAMVDDRVRFSAGARNDEQHWRAARAANA